MASHPQNCYIKIRSLSLVLTGVAMMWTLGVVIISTQTILAQAIEEQDIPVAKCVYDGQEYLMNAHIVNDEQTLSRMDFPDLPDNNAPQMILEKGETVTMELDGDKPVKLDAFLVDYDADVTETYPLKKINDNTFEVTETGIKTLEAVATFTDNTVSYTLLVDIEDKT
jgi:hypothetical protein